MLDALDELNARTFTQYSDPETLTRIAQYEMAFRMQTSVPELTDLTRETSGTLALYGPEVHKPGSFAASALLARRLAGRHTSGNLGGEVTAQDRATVTTPTLRVGDYDAPGEPCGFGRACNVCSSVLGLPHGGACERGTAEVRPEAVSVKPPKEGSAASSFGHPDSALLELCMT
jgi:hypothetical protein